MPEIKQQKVVAPAVPTFNGNVNDVLSTAVPVQRMASRWRSVCLYGRNGLGKSTLAAQFPKPMLVIATEPTSNGGVDSITGVEGITVIVVNLSTLRHPVTGELEKTKGSEKALQVGNRLTELSKQLGQCPYQTVVVDTVTALQEITLAEMKGWDAPATMLNWGTVTMDEYRALSDAVRKILRLYKDLPCHTVFVAQEKDHNPPKDRKESALLRGAQEGSFMAAHLGGATAQWLHDACGYICQLYQDAEVQDVVQQIKVGNEIREETTRIHTGKLARRLRCKYHANYAGRFRSPVPEAVPEYIEARTPQEFFQAMMDVMEGRPTKFGYYPK